MCASKRQTASRSLSTPIAQFEKGNYIIVRADFDAVKALAQG